MFSMPYVVIYTPNLVNFFGLHPLGDKLIGRS